MALPAGARVRAAASFVAQLAAIESDLQARDPAAADARMDALRAELRRVRDVLSDMPEAGRPARFLQSDSPRVKATASRAEQAAREAHLSQLREWVIKPYVLLYACSSTEVVWLAIRHERQLTYDPVR